MMGGCCRRERLLRQGQTRSGHEGRSRNGDGYGATVSTTTRLLTTLMTAAVPLAVAGTAVAVPGASRAVTIPTPPTYTVPVGSNPYDIAISQRRDRAYVVNDGSVSEINLRTHAEVAEYSTGGGEGQNAIALVQHDAQGYITNYQKDTVTVLDTKTRKVVSTITVGAGAVDVVEAQLSGPDRAYVAFDSDSKLVGIDTKTGTVVQTVTLPEPAQTVAVPPRGNAVWAGSDDDGHVFVVDTATGAVTATIDVDAVGPVTSIAFTPNGKQAWVAGLGGVAVVGLDGTVATFLPIQSLFTSTQPNTGTIALNGRGTYAFVEDSTFPDAPGNGEISIIDTTTYAVVAHVTTGVEPESFALDTIRDTAYVPNYAEDTVTYFAIPK